MQGTCALDYTVLFLFLRIQLEVLINDLFRKKENTDFAISKINIYILSSFSTVQ